MVKRLCFYPNSDATLVHREKSEGESESELRKLTGYVNVSDECSIWSAP
jgi:hypothetical protein